ncbi:DUF7113 family protein [Halosegnis longus]|uniref:Uncharacterized protein n=1 Tax=Halosegnis longus TaxID=2216012 RepID=A0AAJ4UVD9_9EURY|nr:hypothetical protein [Halosegnis longus]RNJ25926.1 hypothetical protein Nmn1133_03995 [Salella cibi]
MLQIRGFAGGTGVTGTLYEPGEEPPSYRGAADPDAPYVWVCDSFYQVATGGQAQTIGGKEIRVAFESPTPRGFEERDRAIAAAEEHLRTQFARLGVAENEVIIDVLEPTEA